VIYYHLYLDIQTTISKQNGHSNLKSDMKLEKSNKIPADHRNSTGRMKPAQGHGFRNHVKPFNHTSSNQDIHHEINRTLPEHSIESKSSIKFSPQRSLDNFRPKFDKSENLNR
jgi:hypothetical protein